jgi:two-component system, OmpR family, phosphate regulon sensor histidine kinase PhoR
MVEQLEGLIARLQKIVSEYRQTAANTELIIAEQKQKIEKLEQALRLRDMPEPERLSTLERELEAQGRSASYKQALALTLANAAFDALLVINEQHRIIAINNAAETLFDRRRPIQEHLVDVTGAPELEAMVNDAIANEEESYEDQVVINGRTYRVRAQVIRRDGNFFVGLALQDITELVRLNRARRDMVANISHELAQPIANIRLVIDNLFSDQEKPKRKQSISSLRSIAREADSLQWIVQELRDLSMIETGQAIMRMIPVSATDLVAAAVERVQEQIEAKNLTISSDLPPDLQALADQDQIRRVLVNLLHNAIKWSPRGGTISFSAKLEQDEVEFTVRDEGPGVPDNQTERVFERFYQVDASRSGKDGTGLGLAICRHIVEAHGGRIWAVGSSEAKGGLFAFTLLSVGEIVG